MTKRLWWTVFVLLWAACGPTALDSLDLSASPSQFDALGRTVQLRVVATNADGTIGQGTLTLKASPGELDATTLELDSYGTVRTTLTCVATDPECAPGASVDVRVTWTPKSGLAVRADKSVRIGMPPQTWTAASCPTDAKLVYLFTDGAALYSFNPSTKAMVLLGQLQCGATSATPNSMAVSQDGVAWVSYSDGALYRVNVRTLSCTATSFVPPSGWTNYGMGFSPDSATSVSETLFISGTQGLAKVDLQAMKATFIAPFGGLATTRGAELTSSPDGSLFGFFLPTSAVGVAVARIAKDTGVTSQRRDFPTITMGNQFAFAFSSWGPDFYLYTASDTSISTVTKYSPTADTASTYMTGPAGQRILGAGVSRCGGD